MTQDAYPFHMTKLGHQERLTWLIGAHDRVTNVIQYAEDQASKHSYPAQDGRYIQGIILELINYHKLEIARLDDEAQTQLAQAERDGAEAEAMAEHDLTYEPVTDDGI